MVTYLSQADIIEGFEKVGVSPLERDIRHLRDLMVAPSQTDSASKKEDVVYKTVLSNGTGNYISRGRADAELERDAY